MSVKSSLLLVFDRLPVPQGSGQGEVFSAHTINPDRPHRIGKDLEGRPALLISTSETAAADAPYPVALERLAVKYNVLCEVINSDGSRERGRLTVIKCESNDSELIEYFLRTMEVHIGFIGRNPSCKQVADMVETLIELFRALGQGSKFSIQGLWSELLMIAESSDPRALLRSWHATPGDRYDFCFEGQRVEVKSGARQARSHHFSLEQLTPPDGTTVIVASLFAERSDEGPTVLDLVDRIHACLDNDPTLVAHLHRNVTLTLASDWRKAAVSRFDQRVAKESIRFYEASTIPAVSIPVPSEVSEVRFRVDLSRISACETSYLSERGGIFETIARFAGVVASI